MNATDVNILADMLADLSATEIRALAAIVERNDGRSVADALIALADAS